MRATRPTSIRRTLLLRLLGPLVMLMLLAGAASYGVTRHISEGVLDQWLYDSAVSLANRIHWENGGAIVDLPKGAREILEWDVIDSVFYEVVSLDGKRITGNAFLPEPPNAPTGANGAVYYPGDVSGEGIRALALTITSQDGHTVIVKVAETQHKRNNLATQVLWISLATSLVLTAASAVLIWYGIGRGIASMEHAVRHVRDSNPQAALSPLSTSVDLPIEVLPLVEQINKLLQQLSAAHRVNERFIVNAAHQLRTPVATLRVRLESASRERDPVRRRQALDETVAVVINMSRMLHQLLTLANADDQSSSHSSAARVDIDRIVREEVERRLDDAVALGIDLGYDGAQRPVWVEANENWISEAFVNLLDNALRYGGSGKRVTVGVLDSPCPELYVEDQGPGIASSERERVVDRFYRVPGTPGDGCGLGLAIVKEIAGLSGASFLLESGTGGTGLRARLIFDRRRTSSKPTATTDDHATGDGKVVPDWTH